MPVIPLAKANWFVGISTLLLLLNGAAAGQPEPAPADLNLRTTTRLVTVDTIVTDANSHLVSGLTQNDFTVLEDGKPQKISFFSFESAAQPKAAAPPPKLRPGVFTNRPEYHRTSGPLVVLLLDGLNTAPSQQIYVRQQILKYLASLKLSGPGTAILALGNSLTVLQDFTTDSQLLLAAAQGYKGGRTAADIDSPKVDVPVTLGPGVAPAQGGIPGTTSAGDVAASVAPGTRAGGGFADLAASLQRFEKEVAAFDSDVRVLGTLAALRSISRAVVGYPGRKALLWFSAGFPFSLALDQSDDLTVYKSYRDPIQQTAAMLSDANVAVYPIDARGLSTGDPLADSSTPTRIAQTSMDAAPSANLSTSVWEKFNTQATMDHVARDTGGLVFRNTNDLNGALQSAVADSESYYLLAYYPERKNWDGKFHSVKVVPSNKQLKVRHRTGYFAMDPANWRKAGDEKKLISAPELHTLSATGVLFYGHPVPPQKKGEQTTVEILVDANTISFGSGPEFTYTTDLEIEVGAFSPDGKFGGVETIHAPADLRQETYQQFMQHGIPVRVQMTLKPGQYLVRAAVRDNRTGHIGTLDMPVKVE